MKKNIIRVDWNIVVVVLFMATLTATPPAFAESAFVKSNGIYATARYHETTSEATANKRYVFPIDKPIYFYLPVELVSKDLVDFKFILAIKQGEAISKTLVWPESKEDWEIKRKTTLITAHSSPSFAKEGRYKALLTVKKDGSDQEMIIAEMDFFVSKCLISEGKDTCHGSAKIKSIIFGTDVTKDGEPVNPDVDFYQGESIIPIFNVLYQETLVQQPILNIYNSKGKKIRSYDWDADTKIGNHSTTYWLNKNSLNGLRPGNYKAKVSVRTEPNGDFRVYGEESFTFHKGKRPAEEELAKKNSLGSESAKRGASGGQQETIASLKSALGEKIGEAAKSRDEFLKEIEKLEKELTENGNKLPERKQARIKRDISRKKSYADLISEYHTRLTTGLETLDETEDELRDRKRWQALIDDSFIKKVDQTIKEIINLLNSGPNKGQPIVKERRVKRWESKRR